MKALLLALSLTLTAAAQEAIEGELLDEVTSLPVAGAYITATVPNSAVLRSDRAGRFRVPVSTSKAPFMSIRIAHPDYTPFIGSLDKTISTARVALTRQAVITGQVREDTGFPVDSATIELLHYQNVNGERTLSLCGHAYTDDAGRFRIGQLNSGRYHLRVIPSAIKWDIRYSSSYFPGTLEPDDSRMIEIKAGEVRAANVTLPKVQGADVTVRVIMPPEWAGRGMAGVTLSPVDGTHMTAQGNSPSGTVTLRNIPPGTYTVRSTIGHYPPRQGDVLAEREITVGSSGVGEVILTPKTVQPVDFSGTVVNARGTGQSGVVVILRALNGFTVNAKTNEDGSFTAHDVYPGPYTIDARSSSAEHPVVLLSSRVGNDEFPKNRIRVEGPLAGPLHLKVLDLVIPVTGKVVDKSGRPIPGVAVLLASPGRVPDGRGVTMADGTFRAALYSPGVYKVFATRSQMGITLLRDPDFQAAHEKDFPPVTISETTSAPIVLTMYETLR